MNVEPGLWPGAIRIDGGRTVVLTVSGIDVVLLSADAPEEAVVTVVDATVDLIGIAIDARSTRAIDAVDADVSVSISTLAGSGLVAGAGGLVRLVRSRFEANLAVLSDSQSVGDGGIIAAYDSDVDLVASALVGSTGGTGGAIYASATEPGHTVTLEVAEILDTRAVGDGGQIYLDGPVELSVRGAILTGGVASNGGILALGEGGPVADVAFTDLTDGYAVLNGGAVLVRSGSFTFDSGALRDSRAVYGGSLAVEDVDGPPPSVTLTSALVGGSLAILEGGGIYAATGEITLTDVSIGSNGASEPEDPQDPTYNPGGGGMRITGDADVRAIRVTLCENSAWNGGGALVDTTARLAWRNLRVLENAALDDGGGIVVEGAGLDLSYSSFIGNSSQFGRGAALSAYADVSLDTTLIGWSVGGIAVHVGKPPVEPTGAVARGPATAWWANERGDLAGYVPEGPLATDPLVRYALGTGCNAQQDWHSWYSPLRDASLDGALDPNGSIADIGAYGGPDAEPDVWGTDLDDDDSPVIYDCNDADRAVHPGADELYDGIDSNCDLGDDYDQDQDGFRTDLYGGDDCDDADPAVHPGATEEPYGEVDHNCDGALDADLDGFAAGVDCDESDPDVHPGAVDDDPRRDLDCDGFFDESRPLVPRGCATAPGPAAALLALSLARRRARGPSPRAA